MTFAERFARDFPDRRQIPHPEGCPESYEYEKPREWAECQDANCNACWRRQMPAKN